MSLALKASYAPTRSESGIAQGLEAARSAIEGRFLEVGNVLSSAVDGVGAVISALDRMRDTLSGETVSATTTELAQASETLKSLPEGLKVRRDQLVNLVRTGDGLAGCIDDMRQHLAYLRVFAINIKITAGGIAAAGDEFGIFAQEISDCIELGRGQINAFHADLDALETVLREAISQQDDLGERCGDLLPAVPNALMANAAAIAAHQAKIVQVAARMGDLARDVRKKVGGALAALQIGDITRQRIEHVQLGLSVLADNAEIAALPQADRARAEAFVHRLLAAQLGTTTEDFHREVKRIGENIAGMAGDAGEMLRLRDHAQGRGADGGISFMRGLESSVGQALGLVDDIRHGERIADEVSRSAAEAARGLADQVAAIQTMRADVQMMGLNTTLKCSRIGETGKPLAVIAVELRQHAIQLEASAARALSSLRALSSAADTHEAPDEAEACKASDAASALGDAIARISKAGDEVEGDLITAAHEGGEVVSMLQRAASRFDFHRQVGGYLDDALQSLEEQGGEDAPVGDLTAALQPLLAAMAKSYTMKQEREIHAALTANLGAAPVAGKAPPPVNDDDSLLF
jgi:hypothetical protein